MGPRLKHDEIEALHSRLHNELTNFKASVSVEELNIHLDEGDNLQRTRATSKHLVLAQPPTITLQPF